VNVRAVITLLPPQAGHPVDLLISQVAAWPPTCSAASDASSDASGGAPLTARAFRSLLQHLAFWTQVPTPKDPLDALDPASRRTLQ